MRFHGIRRKINLVSNVLCVWAVVFLLIFYDWQREWMTGHACYINESAIIGISTFEGQVIVGYIDQPGPRSNLESWGPFIWELVRVPDAYQQTRWGFDGVYKKDHVITVALPIWFVIFLVAVKPTWSFISWYRKGRRRIPGHIYCANCDYDLVDMTSGPCPECGKPVEEQLQVKKS